MPRDFLPTRLLSFLFCLLVVSTSFADRDGSEIFNDQCADCHGADGQGESGAYEKPLSGNSSVDLLAKLIERTMPEGDAEAVVGEEAQAVAEYIFHEFYSPAARIRKGLSPPPRVELLRLTVPQYRNAVADLLGQFTPPPKRPRRRKRKKDREEKPDEGKSGSEPTAGLTAEYYQSEGMTKTADLKEQRVDARVDFDFGEASPDEAIKPDQFAVIWSGGLVARYSGLYEFRVSTQNGARLYLNNDQTGQRRGLRDDSGAAGQSALIDAWVSSGKKRVETARVFLVGGRTYPIRLEFFKYKEKSASIRLEWHPPHAPWSVLDHNSLVTGIYPRCFPVASSFPADDRSVGYERGSSVSPEWHQATGRAAIEVADEVINRLPLLANVGDNDEDRSAKLKAFIASLAQAAFRRPLGDDEKRMFTDDLFRGIPPEAAVRRASLWMLSSPHFLYVDLPSRQADDARTYAQYGVAARLAFTIWDSIPDKQLFEMAASGQLADQEAVRKQAERLVDSPRARDKLSRFFEHWLEMDGRDVVKDESLYPEFGEQVAADLRLSLERFIDKVVWSESSDYRELLLADNLFLNERLRDLYDETPDDGPSQPSAVANDFQSIRFEAEHRAGVLTHPYLLSAFAYHNNTSPIHRGVFLTRNVFGRSLRPPPIAVAFKDDEFSPDLTMREKITQLTSDTACMSCHSVINPLGFALESYDAVGRYRTSENGKTVNTTSQYTTATGETLTVNNARELAEYAATSEQAHMAFVVSLFHHMVQQDPAAYGEKTLQLLRDRFAENGFSIRKLMVEIALVAARQQNATDQTESTDSAD